MNETQIDQLNTISAALGTVATQLTDFITANPVQAAASTTPTPAQLSIENETITLSDGSKQEFVNGTWSTVSSS